jgi:hypothetical protein
LKYTLSFSFFALSMMSDTACARHLCSSLSLSDFFQVNGTREGLIPSASERTVEPQHGKLTASGEARHIDFPAAH